MPVVMVPHAGRVKIPRAVALHDGAEAKNKSCLELC
jgi:hypothetical protein